MAFSLETIAQAYYDNAGWFADADETKARLFYTACVHILGLSAQRLQDQTGEFEFPDRRFVEDQLKEVKTFLIKRDWGNWHDRVINFNDFRA